MPDPRAQATVPRTRRATAGLDVIDSAFSQLQARPHAFELDLPVPLRGDTARAKSQATSTSPQAIARLGARDAWASSELDEF